MKNKNGIKAAACAILALSMAVSSAVVSFASSFSQKSFIPTKYSDGVITEVRCTDGTVRELCGVIDTGRFESFPASGSVESFSVKCGGRDMLDVEIFGTDGAKPASNGYYSITVQLEGGLEAFVTGLTPENVGKVQDSVIGCYAEGRDFEIEDMGFIDPEKTFIPGDGDDNLCWAAQTSSMLHYTGWGKAAGFDSYDDIFETFIDAYTDFGSRSYAALAWFFNRATGLSDDLYYNGSYANIKDWGESGGYFEDIAYDSVSKNIDIEREPERLAEVFELMKEGYGAGLDVAWLDQDGNIYGRHALSLWGFVTDNSLSVYDKDHYKALIFSDSDSDMPDEGDRRSAPDRLYFSYMTPADAADRDTWILEQYRYSAVESFSLLAPYSEDIETESFPGCTKDKLSTPDLSVRDILFSAEDDMNRKSSSKIAFGEDIYVYAVYANLSEIPLYEDIADLTLTVTDEDGECVFSGRSSEYISYIAGDYSVMTTETPFVLSDLAAGKYTAEICIDPDCVFTEAFRGNNTLKKSFEVKDLGFDASEAEILLSPVECSGGYTSFEAEFPLLPEEVKHDIVYSEIKAYHIMGGRRFRFDCGKEPEYIAGTKLPAVLFAENKGNAVSFEIFFRLSDGTSFALSSAEYELRYEKLTPMVSWESVYRYTDIPLGKNSLEDDEVFAFIISNDSTSDSEEVRGKYCITMTKDGVETAVTDPADISLGRGEDSGTLYVDSWNEGLSLSGEYEIGVKVYGDFGEVSTEIGLIRFEEARSTAVDTYEKTVDAFDGRTSFYEAVDFAQNGGGSTVTFDSSLYDSIVFCDEAIEIYGDIVIDGSASEDGTVYGISLLGAPFRIAEGANVTLRGVNLFYGVGGMTIYGKLSFEDCRFSLNYGDSIRCIGGSLSFKNCCFTDNDGRCVNASGPSKIDILNTTFYANRAGDCLLVNDGGEMNIVNSSFVLNATGGMPIIRTGEDGVSRILGCLISSNENDEAGDVTEAFASLTTDGLFFECGDPYMSENLTKRMHDVIHTRLFISEDAPSGITVSVKDGFLSFSDDGENYTLSTVPAAFGEGDYKKDELGAVRGFCFGSQSYGTAIRDPLDINGDGELDMKDVLLLRKYIAGYDADFGDADFDTNGDGDIDMKDVLYIRKIIAGMTGI